MKKIYEDMTLAEAEKLIRCRDENGENLCKKRCKFHYPPYYCKKNMFLSTLFDFCQEKGLLTDESGVWEIELDSAKMKVGEGDG